MSDKPRGFEPTHLARESGGFVFLLQLDPATGAAPTMAEVLDNRDPAFKLIGRVWHFKGMPFTGSVSMLCADDRGDLEGWTASPTARFDVAEAEADAEAKTRRIEAPALRVFREYLQASADACHTARQVAEANLLLLEAGLEPVFAVHDGRAVRFLDGDFDPVKAAALLIAAAASKRALDHFEDETGLH